MLYVHTEVTTRNGKKNVQVVPKSIEIILEQKNKTRTDTIRVLSLER